VRWRRKSGSSRGTERAFASALHPVSSGVGALALLIALGGPASASPSTVLRAALSAVPAATSRPTSAPPTVGAAYLGDLAGVALDRPVVGMAATPTGHGYWLVASDGGVFSFGDARFYGSTGGITLDKPVVGMAATPTGHGYWLVASDGGVFSFGGGLFYGSLGGDPSPGRIAGMVAGSGSGYWLVNGAGIVTPFNQVVVGTPPGGSRGAPPWAPLIRAASYGAICDSAVRLTPGGGSVDGNAIQAAIDTAEDSPSGGTVQLPAGTCMISSRLRITGGRPMTLEGTLSPTGQRLTTIDDTVNPPLTGGDIEVASDRNVVQDLKLDQSPFGVVAYVRANFTTFQRLTIVGGPQFFALYFVAQANGQYSVGNELLDSSVISLINRSIPTGLVPCGDGIAWANQDDSLIRGVTFTGTRLAIFEDDNTTVDGYVYYPGPQSCGLDGYYITQPSSGIRLENLTMYGSAGTISNSSTNNGDVSNVVISNEQVRPPRAGGYYRLSGASHGLLIGNSDGVTVSQSNFDSGNTSNSLIEFDPATAASVPVVEGSTVPEILLSGRTPDASQIVGSISDARFLDDVYPARSATTGVDETFIDPDRCFASFSISGGTTYNTDPDDTTHRGLAFGSNMIYTVSGLAGY
jgi:hypothetical protein